VILEGVTLIAGFTDRAKAYVQALARAGLTPEATLLYGQPGSGRPGQSDVTRALGSDASSVFIPALSVSLLSSLEEGAWNHARVDCDSVNDSMMCQRMAAASTRLAVFCGYGGEIVAPKTLEEAPFLHAHSGWLPDYRGSTTSYYSWIEEGRLGVSAILLEAEIDTGHIVGRRRYPLPPPGVDMDYQWDPAIRADLLVRVLDDFAREGELPAPQPQQLGAGRTFYVIHPVLKHLALLADPNAPRNH